MKRPQFTYALSDIDFQLGVGMIVPPIPIGFLISGINPGKIIVFAMPFLKPYTIRPIFMIIPGVLIVVLRVLILALVPMILLGQRYAWQNRNGGQQCGTEQGGTVVTS